MWNVSALFKRMNITLFAFITCMLLFTTDASASAAAPNIPQNYRLLIYYGTPSGVNDLWNPEKAAKVFSEYDYVVFGDGLELPDENQHESTVQVIQKLIELKPDIKIFGYVDLGVTTQNLKMGEINNRINLWKATGANGIFLDDAGYDYKVSRTRLNEAVQYIHKLKMPAFINAWRPEDVMSSAVQAGYNPKGDKTALGVNDYYLLEDMLQPTDITNPNDPSVFTKSFRQKMDLAIKYRKILGVKLLSVSVIDYDSYSSNAVRKFFRLNESTAGVFSLDGYGVAPVHFSASKPHSDVVRKFPYIENYMDYYNKDVKYVAKYDNRDYSNGIFRVHSVPGSHFYHYPLNVEY
ncbi:hypothetical protein [Cohnella mopanensis]|uniref:hypothetical protein n=1 Tax=Cohnella mopanensis TaxID=2911966 RepID=UPI001EF91463|nr:hypothetical protein [Cohnella mopanensis]